MRTRNNAHTYRHTRERERERGGGDEGGRERERDREKEKETDREKEKERDRERVPNAYRNKLKIPTTVCDFCRLACPDLGQPFPHFELPNNKNRTHNTNTFIELVVNLSLYYVFHF
jgi:hypothetical protein